MINRKKALGDDEIVIEWINRFRDRQDYGNNKENIRK